MTYTTLMVHLDVGHPNSEVLQVAGDLAESFHANVMGIAVCQPMQIYDGCGYASGDLVDQSCKDIENQIKEVETEFRNALEPRVANLKWQSAVMFTSLSDFIAREARRADLVVTGAVPSAWLTPAQGVNVGDLILQLGRPVLIVPTTAKPLKLGRVVVGWKDTRETRRAISDALPLLKKAAHVSLVEIAASDDLAAARTRLTEVAGWLKRHDIDAESLALLSIGDDSTRMNTIAEEQDADLIVAGAYGHSRLRESVLGGVTRELLRHSHLCSLLSH